MKNTLNSSKLCDFRHIRTLFALNLAKRDYKCETLELFLKKMTTFAQLLII